VRQVPGQRGDQRIGHVGEPVRARVPAGRPERPGRPGERAVYRAEQRVDLLVLCFHLGEDGQRVWAVSEPLAQDGPDQDVLGGVVQVQLLLEQFPAGRDRPAPGRIARRGPLHRTDQAGQVAAERVMRREHDRQIRVAGAVPGGLRARQLLCGHLFSPRVG
jgi:hypothetical protein